MTWSHSNARTTKIPPEYRKGVEAGLVLPDQANTVKVSSLLGIDISNCKGILKLEVTDHDNSADGALNVRIYCGQSSDAVTTLVDTMSLDVDNSGLNSDEGDFDTTGWFAPFWKFEIFGDATDINGTPTCTITYTAVDLAGRLGLL